MFLKLDDKIDTRVKPTGKTMHFYVASTVEASGDKLWNILPPCWLSNDKKFLLNPPTEFNEKHAAKVHPNNWGLSIFKAHSWADKTWLEYDVDEIITQTKAGNLKTTF